MEQLDLSSLSNAIASLDEALKEYEKDTNNLFIRDSCIKRFEYCYDLAIKFISRFLSLTEGNPNEIKQIAFQDKIRRAYSRGLLMHSWDEWWLYRDNRNATSHGYDQHRAEKIVAQIPAFYTEIEFLLKELLLRNVT